MSEKYWKAMPKEGQPEFLPSVASYLSKLSAQEDTSWLTSSVTEFVFYVYFVKDNPD
jgi:hypothetical protein